jgi:general secretion pathway protein D
MTVRRVGVAAARQKKNHTASAKRLTGMSLRVLGAVSLQCIVLLTFLGCTRPEAEPPLPPLPALAGNRGVAPPRVNGDVGSPPAVPPAQISVSPPATMRVAENRPTETGGDVTLDFADTDIREVAAQILGNILKLNYTIDPAVHGTATMRTVQPIPRSQLLGALQTMLSQNGATLVQSANVYRVLPMAATGGPQLAGGAATTGATLVPLRYASAEDLAKLLQPYVQTNAKVIANTGANALLISGDPTSREALVSLVQAFDVDVLAGQSYALFPVENGNASDFATALQTAFRGREGGPLASVVRVVPMQRINSVLVIAPQPRLIDDARVVYGLVVRNRRETVRSWRVYYLQNGRSNDVAYVMQQALTPNHVTAQPTTPTQLPNQGTSQFGGGGGGASNGIGGIAGLGTSGGTATGLGATGGGGTMGGGLAGGGLAGGGAGVAPGRPAPGQAANQPANPLLGGLGGEAGTAGAEAEEMRIIPDPANNSLLIYGTAQELETAEAMLHKIDILPLQVRIDAVIAEVDLNDTLKYGTQFYFNAGITGALSFGQSVNTFLVPSPPGFILSGPGGKSALLAALQDVTNVRVLSSPQLMVLDNQAARLQVGDLVPYLTQNAQSTLVSNAPIVNSIDYRETGVIMDVTPRVNSNGLVTLDIAQEVSAVANPGTTTTPGLNSPTFSERAVQSRVVVQDGQTVGLAGLISDNVSRENTGIPWLKDVPVLGLLAGQQNNIRQRTELLVLLTPHVIHDQRDARAMTEDLREGLRQSAGAPNELRRLPPSGSADPSRQLRRQLHLEP